ncbi:MAG TPA: hypothetical protein VHA71_04210 [Rhodanobacteraceae bacterium]|jgi:hypothetical protein|nr:hypothetical protein [Rhodanobacteraceae bacterium]
MSAASGAAGAGTAPDAAENSALAPFVPHILRRSEPVRGKPTLPFPVVHLP